MTSNESNANIIGFSPDGKSLEILDPHLLGTVVLPNYFKHNKVSSLTRQLNNYGFRTATPRKDSGVTQSYVHKNFRKGRLDLLAGIKRRKAREDSEESESESGKKYRNQIDRIQKKHSEATKELAFENKRLREENESLVEANRRLQSNIRFLEEANAAKAAQALPQTSYQHRVHPPQQSQQQQYHPLQVQVPQSRASSNIPYMQPQAPIHYQNGQHQHHPGGRHQQSNPRSQFPIANLPPPPPPPASLFDVERQENVSATNALIRASVEQNFDDDKIDLLKILADYNADDDMAAVE